MPVPQVRGVSGEAPEASIRSCVEAGDWEPAIEHARRLAAGAGPLTARLAWPATMVLYLQGDLTGAASLPARVPDADAWLPDADADADAGLPDARNGEPAAGEKAQATADRALLAGWAATVEWARGQVSACRRTADRAFALAQASGDARALATAHTVLALLAAAEGDRRGNDRHYALGLAAAMRAGEATLVLRIRANRASQRLEEGDLAGALAELEEALDLVPHGAGPHPAMVGLAQHNRAEVLLRRGRLGVARDGFRSACTILQRVGAGIVAYPLAGLGESHELRGDLPQARAAYEEAVQVAGAPGSPRRWCRRFAGWPGCWQPRVMPRRRGRPPPKPSPRRTR